MEYLLEEFNEKLDNTYNKVKSLPQEYKSATENKSILGYAFSPFEAIGDEINSLLGGKTTQDVINANVETFKGKVELIRSATNTLKKDIEELSKQINETRAYLDKAKNYELDLDWGGSKNKKILDEYNSLYKSLNIYSTYKNK